MNARLIVESGSASPRLVELDEGRTIRLGRHRGNHLVLQDRHASRWHASVFSRNGCWYIRDEDSTTNVTRVNDQPLLNESPLVNGHILSIGQIKLRFTSEQIDPDSLPPLPPLEEDFPSEDTTHLQPDELTELVRFGNAALRETCPHQLVTLALDIALAQTGGDLAGFLGLDEAADLKVLRPAQARFDRTLSQQLTRRVRQEGKSVWLASPHGRTVDSDSLSSFRDALCIPLLVRVERAESQREAPLGAMHLYKLRGVFDQRQVHFSELLAGTLSSALYGLRRRQALQADNLRLRKQTAGTDQLVGSSPAIVQLQGHIQRIARTQCTVLIRGESGVGKELVARGLHKGSPRAHGPLVSINCATITSGRPESDLFGHLRGAFTGAIANHRGFFSQADMGTLFLDEIAEMSLEIQGMLLRVLETRKVRPVGSQQEVHTEFRLIAATNKNLEQMVREGRFREDLFYRLTAHLQVPPLRDHLEDVPDLAAHFLAHYNAEYHRTVHLSSAAIERLCGYRWPGNVRQLRSVIEIAVAMADDGETIHAGDLRLPTEPDQQPPGLPVSLNLEELEEWAIRQALAKTSSNRTRSAQILGIHRDTLIRKLKEYNIEQGE